MRAEPRRRCRARSTQFHRRFSCVPELPRIARQAARVRRCNARKVQYDALRRDVLMHVEKDIAECREAEASRRNDDGEMRWPGPAIRHVRVDRTTDVDSLA